MVHTKANVINNNRQQSQIDPTRFYSLQHSLIDPFLTLLLHPLTMCQYVQYNSNGLNWENAQKVISMEHLKLQIDSLLG